MSRAEYLGSLIDTLPTLTDNQVKYLYYLVEAMFGDQRAENTAERGTHCE